MDTPHRIAVSVLCAGLLAFHPSVRAADSDKAALQDLMVEGDALNKSLVKATVVKKQLAKADQELKGSQAALDSAARQLKEAARKLQIEGTSRDQQAQIQISRGCGIGGSSPVAAWVAACNAEVDRINAWGAKLANSAEGLKAYSQKLAAEQTQVSQATQTWVLKSKQSDADLNDINAALADWGQRYNALVFKSATYDRLVHTDLGTQQCAQLSDDPSEGELEVAHRCLQWLWDGATPP